MRQYTHKGLREGTARQPELIGREDLIKSAPTEPEAFLLWARSASARTGSSSCLADG